MMHFNRLQWILCKQVAPLDFCPSFCLIHDRMNDSAPIRSACVQQNFEETSYATKKMLNTFFVRVNRPIKDDHIKRQHGLNLDFELNLFNKFRCFAAKTMRKLAYKSTSVGRGKHTVISLIRCIHVLTIVDFVYFFAIFSRF